MEITDEIRELILIGASSLELRKKSIEDGMITLRESGLTEDTSRSYHHRGSSTRNGGVKRGELMLRRIAIVFRFIGSCGCATALCNLNSAQPAFAYVRAFSPFSSPFPCVVATPSRDAAPTTGNDRSTARDAALQGMQTASSNKVMPVPKSKSADESRGAAGGLVVS